MSAERMTEPTRKVLRALLDHPDRERYGLEPAKQAAIANGAMYGILVRLEDRGWGESRSSPPSPTFQAASLRRRRPQRATSPGHPHLMIACTPTTSATTAGGVPMSSPATVTVAPLPIEGGTGSPVNPIATF